MDRPKIRYLQALLVIEVKEDRKRYNKVKKAADEIARVSANSPSQSGDRFHSQGQADIVRATMVRLEKCLAEVQSENNLASPVNIRPACYIQLNYNNGRQGDFYFLSEPLSLSGVKIVSSNSPFGKELAGKKVGDKFRFDLSGNEKAGKIIAIE